MKLSDPDLFREVALIDGNWIARPDMQVIDPASGAAMGSIPDITAEETMRAISAAERAMVEWRARSPAERADILMRWHDLMQDNTEDLARILTAEQGKPLAEARGEVAHGASFIRWFAEEARHIDGAIIPSPLRGKKILAWKEPVGASMMNSLPRYPDEWTR